MILLLFSFLLWLQVIPPYQTKSVMRASFTGRVETNHTAFIRIKTNHSSSSSEEEDSLVVLTLEVEVSSGMYWAYPGSRKFSTRYCLYVFQRFINLTKMNISCRSINLTRFTFLDPGSLFLRNKSYWIHEGPSKSVQVSSCGIFRPYMCLQFK